MIDGVFWIEIAHNMVQCESGDEVSGNIKVGSSDKQLDWLDFLISMLSETVMDSRSGEIGYKSDAVPRRRKERCN